MRFSRYSTTVRNITNRPVFFGFLGPHGRTLLPGEEFTEKGDLLSRCTKKRRAFSSLNHALQEGLLALVSTPKDHIYDEGADETRVLQIDNGIVSAEGVITSSSDSPEIPFDLLNGLVADWPMEEAMAERFDLVSGYSLEDVNGGILSTTGIVGNAAQVPFAEYFFTPVTAIHFGSADSFTIELWIKDLAGVSEDDIFISHDGEGPQFIRSANGIKFALNNEIFVSVNAPFADFSTWRQMIAVCDSVSLKAYADGVLSESNLIPSTVSAPTSGLTIGLSGSFLIDNLRFWSRALSDSEIAWLYNNGASRSHDELG